MLSKETYIQLKLEGNFHEIMWQYLLANRTVVRFSREQFFSMVTCMCNQEIKTPKPLIEASCSFFENLYGLTWITKNNVLILVGNREDFFITKIPEQIVEELELTEY